MSSVSNNFLTSSASILPPSGSAASIHREMAIVCFTSFALIQTRPFIPTAASNGNLPPRSGNKKCLGSNKLKRKSRYQSTSADETETTYSRLIFKLHLTTNPPFKSPNPSDFRVCASKHSNSGSMSLCASDTRAYTRCPTCNLNSISRVNNKMRIEM